MFEHSLFLSVWFPEGMAIGPFEEGLRVGWAWTGKSLPYILTKVLQGASSCNPASPSVNGFWIGKLAQVRKLGKRLTFY